MELYLHSPYDHDVYRDKFTFNFNITFVYPLFFILFGVTLNKVHLIFELHIRRRQFIDGIVVSSSYIVAAVSLMQVEPMRH